jgi:hypothetical protein
VLAISYITYVFCSGWRDPEMQLAHWAIAFTAGVLVFLGVFGLVRLLFQRFSKDKDVTTTLKL